MKNGVNGDEMRDSFRRPLFRTSCLRRNRKYCSQEVDHVLHTSFLQLFVFENVFEGSVVVYDQDYDHTVDDYDHDAGLEETKAF